MGRLNMDAVREDHKDEPVVFPLCEENVPNQRSSSQYMAEWVERAEFPPTTRSLSQDLGVGSATKDASPRVSKSAPALSVRSRQSAGGMVSGKLQLQLQLQQLWKRQALEKETRELEMEIKRQELELERERRLAELAERKALQELEAQLAEAELIEQRGVGCDDQCLSSDDENEGQNVAELPERDNYSPQRGQRNGVKRNNTKRNNVKRNGVRRNNAKRNNVKRNGAKRDGVKRNNVKRNNVKRNNVKRSNVKRNGVKQDGVKRNNVKRNGVKRNRVKQKGMTWNNVMWNSVKVDVEKRTDLSKGITKLNHSLQGEEMNNLRKMHHLLNNSFRPIMYPLSTHLAHNNHFEHRHTSRNHSLQCRNIGITNSKTKPEECMLVSKVCRVLCQERTAM